MNKAINFDDAVNNFFEDFLRYRQNYTRVENTESMSQNEEIQTMEEKNLKMKNSMPIDFEKVKKSNKKTEVEKKVNTVKKSETVKKVTPPDKVMPLPSELNNGSGNNYAFSNSEIANLKYLYSRASKALLPYVESVLAEYDHVGSPIYNQYIDRDTIGTIVDQVIYDAKGKIPEVEEIYLNDNFSPWADKELLRNLVESLVINSIYTEMRPKLNRPVNDNGEAEKTETESENIIDEANNETLMQSEDFL